MEVGDDTDKDDRRPEHDQQPGERGTTIEEQPADPSQERHERKAKAIIAPERPETGSHGDLVQDQVAADHRQHEADEKLAQAARCSAGSRKWLFQLSRHFPLTLTLSQMMAKSSPAHPS